MGYKFCGRLDTLAEIYENLGIDVKRYIDQIIDSNDSGSCLLRLLKVVQKNNDIPTNLCSTLMQKYQLRHQKLDFYAFCFNEQWMNITLEDVLFLIGLPIDGEPVFSTEVRDNGAFFTEFGINAKTLTISQLKELVLGDWEMELKIKALLLLVINCMIIPSGDGNVCRSAYIQFIKHLEKVNNYAWGAALLSYLYHGMREFAKGNKNTCDGNMWVVLGFFVYHIRTLREKLGIELPVDQPQAPLLFSVAEALQKIGRDHYGSYEEGVVPVFDNLQDQDIDWHPYRTEMVPLVLQGQIHFRTRLSPLFCLNFVEHHLPHLLARQFEVLDGVNLDGVGADLKRIKFKANRGSLGPNLTKRYVKELLLWKKKQLCGVIDTPATSSSHISSSPANPSSSSSMRNSLNNQDFNGSSNNEYAEVHEFLDQGAEQPRQNKKRRRAGAVPLPRTTAGNDKQLKGASRMVEQLVQAEGSVGSSKGKGKKRQEKESLGGKGKKRKEEESVGDNFFSPNPIIMAVKDQQLENMKKVLHAYSSGNSLAPRGEYWSVSFWNCILQEYNQRATQRCVRLQDYVDILLLGKDLQRLRYTRAGIHDQELKDIFIPCDECCLRVISLGRKIDENNIHVFTENDLNFLKRVFWEYATGNAGDAVRSQRGQYRSTLFWEAILGRYNIISQSHDKTIDDMVAGGRELRHRFATNRAMGLPSDDDLNTIFQYCSPCRNRIPVFPYTLMPLQDGTSYYSRGTSSNMGGTSSNSRGESVVDNTRESCRKRNFDRELNQLAHLKLLTPDQAATGISTRETKFNLDQMDAILDPVILPAVKKSIVLMALRGGASAITKDKNKAPSNVVLCPTEYKFFRRKNNWQVLISLCAGYLDGAAVSYPSLVIVV